MATKKYTAQQLIEVLEATHGMVYLAAERLGCTPQTVYNYLERYPKVRQAKATAEGRMLDVGEVKLFEQVKAGEPWAIKYLLSTKGKGRGYSEKMELAHGQTVKVIRLPHKAASIEAWAREVKPEPVSNAPRP